MNNNGEAVLKAIELLQPETVIESKGQGLSESFLVLSCFKLGILPKTHSSCIMHQAVCSILALIYTKSLWSITVTIFEWRIEVHINYVDIHTLNGRATAMNTWLNHSKVWAFILYVSWNIKTNIYAN